MSSTIEVDCSECGDAPVSDLERLLCDDCAYAAELGWGG